MRISRTAIRKWCTYELPETKAAFTGPVLVFVKWGPSDENWKTSCPLVDGQQKANSVVIFEVDSSHNALSGHLNILLSLLLKSIDLLLIYYAFHFLPLCDVYLCLYVYRCFLAFFSWLCYFPLVAFALFRFVCLI